MRSVWKGSIDFGPVTIPVRAYGATEEHGVTLHQIHQPDSGRIRLKRICDIDGAEVASGEIVKGYELPGGDMVVLTDSDLASLPLSTTSSIEVRAFAPIDEIDPIQFAKNYYLEPDPAGTKPYVLFSEALQQSGRVAIVKVALRQRERLGVLRVRDQVIVLATMLWPDEVRKPDFPFQHEDVDVRLPELQAAVSLIEELSGNFTPEHYTDHYREALLELVEAKAEGNDVVQPTANAQQTGATDLVAALRASVEDARARSGGAAATKRAVSKAKAAAHKAAQAKDAAVTTSDKHRRRTRSR